MSINKAMLDSYARNLAGQVIGAIVIVMQTANVGSPVDFGSSEWLLVANALWSSAVPTLIRWANKKDPAFGRVATSVATEATKKLETAVAASAAKKTAAKKTASKKTVK
jgi:type IV secretory pathway TrbD component